MPKVIEYGEATSSSPTDLLYTVHNPGGAVESKKIQAGNLSYFIDYSDDTVIWGWAEGDIISKKVLIERHGKLATCRFFISGSSNDEGASFTVPYRAKTDYLGCSVPIQVYDNGSPMYAPGAIRISNGTNVIYADKVLGTYNGFTAYNYKSIEGIFSYPIEEELKEVLVYDSFSRGPDTSGSLGSTETTGPDGETLPSYEWQGIGENWTISAEGEACAELSGVSYALIGINETDIDMSILVEAPYTEPGGFILRGEDINVEDVYSGTCVYVYFSYYGDLFVSVDEKLDGNDVNVYTSSYRGNDTLTGIRTLRVVAIGNKLSVYWDGELLTREPIILTATSGSIIGIWGHSTYIDNFLVRKSV